MKKIGLLILSLVFALGAVGVGYAMWYDTVYIDGEVNTGCVDLDIDSVSGEWVYKCIKTYVPPIGEEFPPAATKEDMVVTTEPIVGFTDYFYYVASASAIQRNEYAEEDEEIWIVLDNIFPTIGNPLVADVLFTYPCTVPAHIDWVVAAPCASSFSPCLIWKWTVTTPGNVATVYYGAEVTAVQLHEGYTLYLEVYFDPACLQNADNWDLQDLSCSFVTEFYVHQWNEDF
jgi:hypothetical protein